MRNWNRIGDDNFAEFGDHSWTFSFPNGTYTVTVSQSEQNSISVKYRNAMENWPVQRKEQSTTQFKLSGLADWTPEILHTASWFELTICPKPTIEYWVDKAIFRTDLALL